MLIKYILFRVLNGTNVNVVHQFERFDVITRGIFFKIIVNYVKYTCKYN